MFTAMNICHVEYRNESYTHWSLILRIFFLEPVTRSQL